MKVILILAAFAAVAFAQGNLTSTGNTTHVTGNSTTTTANATSTSTTTTSTSANATSTSTSSGVATSGTSSTSSSTVSATTGVGQAYSVTVQSWFERVNGTCQNSNGTQTLTVYDRGCTSFPAGVFGAFSGSLRSYFFNQTVTVSVYSSDVCDHDVLAAATFDNGVCTHVDFVGFGGRELTLTWSPAGASTSSSSSTTTSSTTGDVGSASSIVPSFLAVLLASAVFAL